MYNMLHAWDLRFRMGQMRVHIYARITISHAQSVELPATFCTLG